MSILLFEDSAVAQLTPITSARPAFCITAGSFHLLDLLSALEEPLVAQVRPFLRALCELDCRGLRLVGDVSLPADERPRLALNARIVPSVSTLKTIQSLLVSGPKQPSVVWHGEQIAAVIAPTWAWSELADKSNSDWASLLQVAATLPRFDCSLPLMSFPHDVIAANMQVIAENLQYRIESGRYEQQADGVFVAAGAKLGQYVLTETDTGPIVIDEGASVGPYTLLRGPIYIGPKARILEHAAIKDAVSLGHTTKIGGEVEAAVVEPYSNKQHHGFLGHSYLGSWINLGAGTCNSDLKNTYGTVNMEYPGGKAATGMQFLGCVMGDYSKTAINTGIFTGKVIGVCSMMYGFVTSNVPSYVNYARLFGQMATLPPEVMIATQQRMFSRRKVEQRPCDMQLLHDMYRHTQPERDRFGDELAF
ncbi:putative sugar nucleotidyl transferase [Aureliella helgolandensis]|uniref:putative sugar nucleotidyl transferase n=1 Tax=Aureliella helgolandensis TaxID=2527968 RepID=UPI0011A9E0A6|nr:putative sugar nucleotidyl transferase [Aureliella helgolandensis]